MDRTSDSCVQDRFFLVELRTNNSTQASLEWGTRHQTLSRNGGTRMRGHYALLAVATRYQAGQLSAQFGSHAPPESHRGTVSAVTPSARAMAEPRWMRTMRRPRRAPHTAAGRN